MSIQAWDVEIQSIAADLEKAYQDQCKANQNDRKAMLALKMGIFQLQSLVGQILNRATEVEKRKGVMHPREASLLHWSFHFMQQQAALNVKQTESRSKLMWLRLLAARIPGVVAKPNLEISDEHLIEMSIRHKNLAQSQRFLSEQHNQLLRRKQQLLDAYQGLSARVANREAAGCLTGRFGHNSEKAPENHSLRSFGRLLRKVGNCVHQSQQSQREARELEQSIQRETARIMTECHALSVSDTEYPRSPEGRLRKYEKNLKHIEDLQLQVHSAASHLHSSPPAAKPFLLKNQPFRV